MLTIKKIQEIPISNKNTIDRIKHYSMKFLIIVYNQKDI